MSWVDWKVALLVARKAVYWVASWADQWVGSWVEGVAALKGG